MNINIEDDLYSQIQEKLKSKKKVIGKSYECTVDYYCNLIISKHLKRLKHLENWSKNPQNINNGVDWITAKRRHFDNIIIRDQRTCRYCGKYLHLKDMTIDHLIPPLRGGDNSLKNLVLSCKLCNQDKGVLTEWEYRYKQLENAAKRKAAK
jgi:5-methylcytosine-specific restriction endonuclease McrA